MNFILYLNVLCIMMKDSLLLNHIIYVDRACLSLLNFIELFQSSNRTILKNLGNFTYKSFEKQTEFILRPFIPFQIDIMLLYFCIMLKAYYCITICRYIASNSL